MAQSGFTPIQLYRTATASAVPSAANLGAGELAINTNDGKLFFKNSAGAVAVLADVTPAPGGVSYVAKTANFTVANLQGVLANTSSGAFTVTLPASPTLGDQVIIADAGGAFGTNALIVGRNGSTIEGTAADLNLDINGVSVQFVYSGSTWEVYAQIGGNGGNAVTLTGTQTLTNKTINYANNTLVGVASLTGTQTLTNKTLTSPVLTTPVLSGITTTASGSMEFLPADYTMVIRGGGSSEGTIKLNCAANSHGQSLTAQPHALGITNEMLLPIGANSTLVSLVSADTLTNKTINYANNTFVGVASLGANTFTATQNLADNIVQRPVLKDYAETKVAMAANAVDLALGNVQTKTISGAQTLTFSNPPASGLAGSFTLILTNGGSAAVTFPSSVDWPAATAPTLTTSGVDVLTFVTIDGGTIWYGIASGIGMA